MNTDYKCKYKRTSGAHLICKIATVLQSVWGHVFCKSMLYNFIYYIKTYFCSHVWIFQSSKQMQPHYAKINFGPTM